MVVVPPSMIAMVRRADVMLRSAYPHLCTRIYELAPLSYRIVFDASMAMADEIKREFENIRPIGVVIDISNEIPANFAREIAPISDHDLAHGLAGLGLTREGLRTVILGKFPELPELISLENSKPPGFTLKYERALSEAQKQHVRKFMSDYMPDWPVDFSVGVRSTTSTSSQKSKFSIPGDILEIRPACLRAQAPQFVREDEACWFDNLDAVFEGGLSPSSIVNIEDAGMACYMDAGAFAQIDLRQAILCYDTVYLSPPLTDGHGPSFWERQAVTREEVLELVAAGRLKLVLNQPEERTDPGFLSTVYNLAPNAIIGRRRASALLAADLVQTADEYRLNNTEFMNHASEISNALSTALNVPAAEIVQLLFWPNGARRACLLPLMRTGLMSLGGFGSGKLLGEQLSRITGRDVRLEAIMTSMSVHVAHALFATLIPPLEEMGGWIKPRRVIADRLNFYRSFNKRIAAAWAANEQRREESVRILPPIPIFDFNRHAKINDLIKVTSYPSTRRKGRSLINRIAALAPEERGAEIDRLSAELYELGVRNERRAMLLDATDNMTDLATALAGISIFPLRSAWGVIQSILQVGRRIKAIDSFIDDLENDITPTKFRNSDLDFLSKVERVAELWPQKLPPISNKKT